VGHPEGKLNRKRCTCGRNSVSTMGPGVSLDVTPFNTKIFAASRETHEEEKTWKSRVAAHIERWITCSWPASKTGARTCAKSSVRGGRYKVIKNNLRRSLRGDEAEDYEGLAE
jgi:hypothetical protein